MDLLFVEDAILCHCIDEATRWSTAVATPSKSTGDLQNALVHGWFRIFGPHRTILSDSEGALLSEDTAFFAKGWGVAIRARPTGAHANIAECHHEALRQTLHRLLTDARAEGIAAPVGHLAAEACFVKNALTNVNGFTPFQASLGVIPLSCRILRTME